MTNFSSEKLARIRGFFDKTGSERLQGLDPSYFSGLSQNEKEEAWNFLSDRFALSTDTISGLFLLDQNRAVSAFKKEIDAPISASLFPEQRENREECRLLMLQYINSVEPDVKYVMAMNEFAASEFEDVRTLFVQSIPTHGVTSETVDALKAIIFTETEILPRVAAIQKFMLLHGMDFDRKNPLYKSLYKSLSSDDPKEKLAAMARLEDMQGPDYA
jgi:hypothetical protein